MGHCETCTCGCTCGFGGLHDDGNPRCDLNTTPTPTERESAEETL
jgi:hypothetical protein